MKKSFNYYFKGEKYGMKAKKLLSLVLICSIIATYFVQSVVTTSAAEIKGDINNDSVINMADVILLASAFNAVSGDLKYAPIFDINNDGVINMADVIIIAANFGKTVEKATPTSTKVPNTPTPTKVPATSTPTPTSAGKFHCFILTGQSNMAGYPKAQDSDRVKDPRILSLGYYNNQWAVAAPPLHENRDSIGPGDWFAKTLIQKLPANDTIGLIPCAVSGIGIDDLIGSKYSWILEKAKKAKEKGGIIEGILFHQGETNCNQADWPNKVNTLMTKLKNDLGLGDIPILAGELLYTGDCKSHNTLINKLPSVVKNCYVVSAQGLTEDSSDAIYNLHFDHNSQVTFGKRYAEKMIEALGLK